MCKPSEQHGRARACCPRSPMWMAGYLGDWVGGSAQSSPKPGFICFLSVLGAVPSLEWFGPGSERVRIAYRSS